MDKWFGLVGGLGVGATVFYYEQLAKAHSDQGEPMHLVIAHADMTRVLEHVRSGESIELAEYFAGLIRRLADAGASFVAINAVAPHFCYRDLVPRSVLPLVNLGEKPAQEIQVRGYRRVSLFGTRFAMESGLFGLLGNVEIVKPSLIQIDEIHSLYSTIAKTGRGNARQFNALSRIAEDVLNETGVDAIVLAGTELSLVFNEENMPFPAVDCARLHLQAILERWRS